MSYGPCMCGGCRRCLHDQGYHCGDESCCGPETPPAPEWRVKIRFDAADWEQTSEGGYHGHNDRVLLIWRHRQTGVDKVREAFDATDEGIAELVESIAANGEQEEYERRRGPYEEPPDDWEEDDSEY